MATKKLTEKEMRAIADEAHQAGHAAASLHEPTPMVVQEHENPLDDSSPVKKEYHVPQGVCGFAWINIKPATKRFPKYLMRTKEARSDSYYGGATVWVGGYGQSFEKKRAYANAYAVVIRHYFPELRVWPMSRLD